MEQNKRDGKDVEKILSKIRKALALAGDNPSEEEAKAAALKAQELMAKYNVTLTDAEEDQKLEFSESSFSCGVDNQWKYSLASVISRNFRCHHYWLGKRNLVFYGYKVDCEIARDVFGMLFKVCKKRMTQVADKAYVEYGTSKGVRYSYTRGFVQGVKEVLDKQCTALMIVTPTEVTESFEEMSKDWKCMSVSLKGADRFDRDSYNQGIRDGKDAMNSRAIESSKKSSSKKSSSKPTALLEG